MSFIISTEFGKLQHKNQNEIYITSRRSNKTLEDQEDNKAEKLKANLGNHGTYKKRQTAALEVVKKITGDGHVLKESNHTTYDKIKGNTRIYINKIQPECYEYF